VRKPQRRQADDDAEDCADDGGDRQRNEDMELAASHCPATSTLVV